MKLGYNMPIIFITAHAEAASRPEVRQGAIACLIKPFSDIELQNALKLALSV